MLVSRGRRESLEKEECLYSLDLKTATESLLRTVFGSVFQTAGTVYSSFFVGGGNSPPPPKKNSQFPLQTGAKLCALNLFLAGQ